MKMNKKIHVHVKVEEKKISQKCTPFVVSQTTGEHSQAGRV